MDQQNNNRKRKDLRQILKEPKLKHKKDPVVGRETDSTQCETFGSSARPKAQTKNSSS
jgi:hypothetical protein